MLEQLLRVGNIRKVAAWSLAPCCRHALTQPIALHMQAYLVIRTKRGESQQKRLKTILQSPVFKLHHEPQQFRKVPTVILPACRPESHSCIVSSTVQTL